MATSQPPTSRFEIVRRRLFDPITPNRPGGARRTGDPAFSSFYRDRPKDFPTGVRARPSTGAAWSCHPIHPELFDRFFEDWSTLDKVPAHSRCPAADGGRDLGAVKRDDRSLMIMPGTLPIDSAPVLSGADEVPRRGLGPVIKTDVDGPERTAAPATRENKHFGRYSAARRTARAVYMGSAPPDTNRGVDIKSVLLGCLPNPANRLPQFASAPSAVQRCDAPVRRRQIRTGTRCSRTSPGLPLAALRPTTAMTRPTTDPTPTDRRPQPGSLRCSPRVPGRLGRRA